MRDVLNDRDGDTRRVLRINLLARRRRSVYNGRGARDQRVTGGVLVVTAAALALYAAPARSVHDPPVCNGRPATIIGTPGPDTIRAHQVRPGDRVKTFGGDDRVATRSGGVEVCAGSGDDRVVLEPALSSARGVGGGARFEGGPGDDFLGSRIDASGWLANVRLILIGGTETDRLIGGPLDDQIEGGSGPDRILALEGRDDSRGGGGQWNDVIKGGGGNDFLAGAGGDDFLKGDGGPLFSPPGGHDSARGGPGSDRCEAEEEFHCER